MIDSNLNESKQFSVVEISSKQNFNKQQSTKQVTTTTQASPPKRQSDVKTK